jgi:hypothetical protein
MPEGQQLPEDYKEYLRRNVNALERFGDALTGVDERVDYVVAKLEALKLSADDIAKLTAAVQRLEELGLIVNKTEQVTFSRVLQPLEGYHSEKEAPIDGTIISVIFSFPAGCYDPVTGNYLVDMVFGHGDAQICPSEGTLALNNAPVVFPISERVQKNDNLWVTMENADALNPHGVSIISIIVGS